MTHPHEPDTGHAVPNSGRRLMLASILASYASSFIPWPLANAQTVTAASGAAPEAFLNVSRVITGRAALDSVQASRLYAGLVATVPSFASELNALAAFIGSQPSAVSQLQASLDAANVPFAKLPRQIATAWYVGVVGAGPVARCVTYETSLMNLVVSDRLKPPSYAYGPYGSWGRNPLSAA
jgi:hypothetical protein